MGLLYFFTDDKLLKTAPRGTHKMITYTQDARHQCKLSPALMPHCQQVHIGRTSLISIETGTSEDIKSTGNPPWDVADAGYAASKALDCWRSVHLPKMHQHIMLVTQSSF